MPVGLSHASGDAACRCSAKPPPFAGLSPSPGAFRSMVLTLESGLRCFAPRAHWVPVYPRCFPIRPCRFTAHRAEAVGVGFRVEPVVTHPAPPQTRTCAMHASGSSGARVSALLWRITVLPCMAVRGCGRSWVWARPTSPAAADTSPNGLGSCGYGDSARTATPSPHRGGPPPTDGSSLGYHSTESAPVTAGTAAGTGMARARDA